MLLLRLAMLLLLVLAMLLLLLAIHHSMMAYTMMEYTSYPQMR
jgi:hypothetical protein